MSEHQQRIIHHMNDDHQLAVVDYVVVYGKVPKSSIIASSAKISDVTETDLTITYKSKTQQTHTLVFKWNEDLPERQNVVVSDFRQVKDKLVSMAKYAANEQGYSHQQVTKATFPDPVGLLIHVLVWLFVIGWYDRTLIRRLLSQDQLLSQLQPYVPLGLHKVYDFAEAHNNSILAITLGAHLLELAFIGIPRLIRFRVPFPQKLAWAYCFFLEGFPSHRRFKKLVSE